MSTSKSEYATLLKVLIVLVVLVIVAGIVFFVQVPCTIQLGAISLRGHTTIWEMLTGASCSYP